MSRVRYDDSSLCQQLVLLRTRTAGANDYTTVSSAKSNNCQNNSNRELTIARKFTKQFRLS